MAQGCFDTGAVFGSVELPVGLSTGCGPSAFRAPSAGSCVGFASYDFGSEFAGAGAGAGAGSMADIDILGLFGDDCCAPTPSVWTPTAAPAHPCQLPRELPVMHLSGGKRKTRTDEAAAAVPAMVLRPQPKRVRTTYVTSPSSGPSSASPLPAFEFDELALPVVPQAVSAKATTCDAALFDHATPRVSATEEARLAKLFTVKRNGNYDAYLRTNAFEDATIPLQRSLVGTRQCPGFLVALQTTDGRGVTDRFLSDMPGGVPKWVLFLRTCMYRAMQADEVGPLDPLRQLLMREGAFKAHLVALGTNAARGQFLADQLVRLVRLVRPEETFTLPSGFVHGFRARATVEACLHIACDRCGNVQTWRKCRRCYKKGRRRPRARMSHLSQS